MNEQRKLRLSRETLRELTSEERRGVIGGTQQGPTHQYPCETVLDTDESDRCTNTTGGCPTENNSAVC